MIFVRFVSVFYRQFFIIIGAHTYNEALQYNTGAEITENNQETYLTYERTKLAH